MTNGGNGDRSERKVTGGARVARFVKVTMVAMVTGVGKLTLTRGAKVSRVVKMTGF